MKMTGGRAVVEAARANGMGTIFGLPGAQIYALFDGLHATGTDLIVPRHEQAAAYMAMGYASRPDAPARSWSFRPRVQHRGCPVHGDGQLRGGVPMRQVLSQFLAGANLHELADQAGTLRTLIRTPCASTTRRIRCNRRTRRTARAAAARGPCRWRCAGHDGSGTERRPGARETRRDEPEPDLDIAAAADPLAAAKRPMIMVARAPTRGRGSPRTREVLNAPVTAFRSGRGVVPEDSAGLASARA
jgi:acetolactate synthase-1/2/3 large subunit